MNKSELIEKFSTSGGLTQNKAEQFINTFFDSISTNLEKGGRVEIRGFGALAIKKYHSYVGRNPKTGERITVADKCLPIWRTGLELKSRVDR